MTPSDTPIMPPDSPRRIIGRHFTQRQLQQLTLSEVYFIQCTFTDISFAEIAVRNIHLKVVILLTCGWTVAEWKTAVSVSVSSMTFQRKAFPYSIPHV